MRERDETAWLANLKTGDDVAVCFYGSFYGPRYEFVKVTSDSAKYVTAYGARYRRQDGREAGSHYHSCIQEPIQELHDQVAEKKRRQEIVNHLDAQKWNNYDTSKLEAIYALSKNETN